MTAVNAQGSSDEDRRARTTLLASCLAMLTLGVNGTAIMAALPTIRLELALTAGELEWAINAYLVVSAACIIPAGRLSDQLGARNIAMAGLAIFAIAAAVVATAEMPAALLAGRALQALAAALGVPGTLAAINEATASERRASAIGAWAGFLMLGFSLGPLVGGVLTHYAEWRIIFWGSGAIMLVATGGLLVAGGAGATPARLPVARFDWTGFALLAVFMTSSVSALHALPGLVRAPLGLTAFVALAAVALFGLLKAEQRSRNPLLDLSLFRAQGFVPAVALASIAMSCILAVLLFYNLEAQSRQGLRLTAVGAGLSLLPLSVGLLMFAFSAPGLVRRFGPRRTLCAGNLSIALASMAMAVAAPTRMWVLLLIGLFVLGGGLALPYATAPRLALSALPAVRAGAGSGLINACTFLGGSIGIAGGAVAFAIGGLPAVMVLIAAAALAAAWLSLSLRLGQ
jgi:MFS family permease